MPKNVLVVLLSIVGSTLALALPSMACAQESVEIDLPTRRLAEALRVLGKRTATNILIDPRLVKNIQAPGIKGTLTAEQALDHLLAGTRLGYRFIDERTIVLKSSEASIGEDINQTSLFDDENGQKAEGYESGTMRLA